jgi:N-acetylmuramoyl-L-alanine amidase
MKNRIKLFLLMFVVATLFVLNVDANRRVKGQRYQNYTVVIDAGHGGYDGGANGVNETVEKDLNLQIALYLRKHLEAIGVKVIMIRDKDMDFKDQPVGTKKRTDLMNRLEIINESNADLLISIHMNSIPDGRWHGAQTFYYPGKKENKILAEAIQKNLIDTLQNTDRKAKSVKSLFLLRKSEPVSALVEAGFLSNYEEAELLNQPAYQEKVALAIYLGILEYLEENSKSKTL